MFWLNTMIFKHHNQKQFICYHFSWIHTASRRCRRRRLSPQKVIAHLFFISRLIRIFFFGNIFYGSAALCWLFARWFRLSCHICGHKNWCLLQFYAMMTFVAHCSKCDFCFLCAQCFHFSIDDETKCQKPKPPELFMVTSGDGKKSHIDRREKERSDFFADVSASRVI